MYAWNFWYRWHPDSAFFNYGQGGLALIFGSLVLLANASEWWRQKLYLPGTGYLATRAYAVYLLHPDSLALLKRLPATKSFLVFTISAWIITLAGAEVLHRLVELPMMRARERFSFSRSAKLSPAIDPHS
jgi:peptidoglycan/LPS O-acetylase OafA/YrhL